MPTTLLCNHCHSELKFDDEPAILVTNENFRNMSIPSDTELYHIQSLIEDADRDLRHYDEEIERLSNTLATLKTHRDDLQRSRDRYRAFSAPQRKLPMEILGEIFSWCCSPSLLVDMHRESFAAPALVISQTCSFWRKVALTMPGLWSELKVHVVYEEPAAAITRLLEIYLLNSGSALLTLDFYGSPLDEDDNGCEPDEDSCIWSILQALLNCGDRWMNCSFCFGWNLLSHADKFLSQPTDYYYPNLKEFRLQSTLESSGHSSIISSIWPHAPALLSLQVPTCNDGTLLFTSEDLQKLVIESGMELSRIFRVFQTFPLLQECGLQIGLEDDFDNDDDVDNDMLSLPITHVNLRSLRCWFYQIDDCANTFASLTLPSLTTLDLTARYNGQQISVLPSLEDLVRRSGCHLTTLKLNGQLVQSCNELLDIFAFTPSLMHLSLDVNRHFSLIDGDFFSRLTFPVDTWSEEITHILLPQLKSCQLSFYTGRELDDNSSDRPSLPPPEDLLSMLTSRRAIFPGPYSKLQQIARFELSAYFLTPILGEKWTSAFSEVEPRLRLLEKEGLELSLEIVNLRKA
ncbi:hypothetical protein D9758_013326 [Tetrapyrgos nigripes]|uniref:F-box domain-containing protein n=1 Tax=Tetrapyrgos nigripes TaxID=182062 RepID=A0A8H5FJM9_9AGAR|nr:hypothetical protein D9758_013326 [Tetrapyrgos nigripes]